MAEPERFNWPARRAELVADGDLKGAEMLDDLLARRHDKPIPCPDGRGEYPPLTDANILDAMRSRARVRCRRYEKRCRLLTAIALLLAAVCAWLAV
jgi:hypothetical protein